MKNTVKTKGKSLKLTTLGFTLIELLAVIVILAIIAVIAVPIVIDIIDDSKKNASLRSAEMYLDALELSIANSTLKEQNIKDETYDIANDGSLCLDSTCTEKLKVEVKGEYPKEGTITINNGEISNIDLKISEKRITKNDKGELIYFPCTIVSGEENEMGSKYICEVSPGVKYNFYVLSYNDIENKSTNDKTKAVTTNLIMDQNINSDGTPAGITGVMKSENANKYSLIKWASNSLNIYGPVIAMDYLYNATKEWINIPPLNYTYNDREYFGITDVNTNIGYISFVSNKGLATITSLFGERTIIGNNDAPLRARMPIYSSDSTITNAPYLYDYLDTSGEKLPYGYWTLSSTYDASCCAYFVKSNGTMGGNGVRSGNLYGVRPVINLKI